MSLRPDAWTVSLVFLACLASGPAGTVVGDEFPSLAEAGLTGGELPAVAGKVVLVDFWASWCAPCKASFPIFGRLHEEYGPRGLVIVAVGVDEKPAAYAGFVKKLAPPFATLHDRARKLVRAVNVPVMPTSYLLDRRGRVRFIHRGFQGAESEPAMRRHIEALLAEGE